jgi:hypothetical protein
MYCENSIQGLVQYQYLSHPHDDLNWNGLVISNNPPLTFTVRQLNQGSVACGAYKATVVIPEVTWTDRNKSGVQYPVGTRYVEINAYGPIGNISVEVRAYEPSYYGEYQVLRLRCNGYYNGAGECQPNGFYDVGLPNGGLGNAYYFDTANIRIQGITRLGGVVEVPPWRFTVTDGDGLIYDRTEDEEPSVAVTCEGYCAPGGSRIGNCCVDCSDLTGNLEAIRQALRRL